MPYISHRYRNAAHRRQNVTQQSRFASIPNVRIQRSSFDRSSGVKTAFNAGMLVPVFVDEALPGDTFSMKASCFGRLATPFQPVMENLYLDWFFFAVPNRLLWDNWKKFNGEQETPGDSTDFLVPRVFAPVGGFAPESMADYFGIPTDVALLPVNALHFRAYNLIYNEWFRDQNLQNPAPIHTGDGPDPEADYKVMRRTKRHDYFTSCLPWPQKGEAVTIPLGEQANITGRGHLVTNQDGEPEFGYFADSQNQTTKIVRQDTSNMALWQNPQDPQGDQAVHWEDPKLEVDFDHPASTAYTDLTSATATTINALREAFQIQRMYEKDARGGTRYTELIRSHFGVTSPDARQQRPEFLGGGTSIVGINPVAQTSETSDDSPQGNLAAYGTTFGSPAKWTHSFTEHCVIVGLASLRADLNYQQGLERMWSRQTRFDFYWPSLANLGEQAVLNAEIYAQGNSQDLEAFGYQERYAEYRYKPSRICGRLRSNFETSLDVWHLAQNFSGLPFLDDSFIEEQPPMQRILAVPFEPHLILDAHFSLRCSRPMPVYSVPGLIDHF